MSIKKFKIANWFIVTNYLAIVASFVLTVFFIIGPIVLWNSSSLLEILPFFLVAICFFAGGIYSISIVPRMKEVIHLSDSQIMQEHSDGTFTTILWKEDFEIRERQFLERLELISQDQQRKIMIEHQIDGYQEICNFIMTKLLEKQTSQS